MISIGFDYLASATILNADNIQTFNGHPIENVQDSRLSRSAWIVNQEAYYGSLYGAEMYGNNPYLNLTAAEDVKIDFDLGAIVSAREFGLAGNNWQNVNITLEWSETDIDSPDGSVTYGSATPENVIMIDMGQQSFRYLRVLVTGVTVAGNYLEIGRMSVGPLYEFPDIGTSMDVDVVSNASRSFSDTRQLYGGPKVVYSRLNVFYPQVDDVLAFMEYFRGIDLYNPIFLGLDEPCLPNAFNLYVTFTEDSLALSRTETGLFSARLSFSETF